MWRGLASAQNKILDEKLEQWMTQQRGVVENITNKQAVELFESADVGKLKEDFNQFMDWAKKELHTLNQDFQKLFVAHSDLETKFESHVQENAEVQARHEEYFLALNHGVMLCM